MTKHKARLRQFEISQNSNYFLSLFTFSMFCLVVIGVAAAFISYFRSEKN